MKGKKRRRHHGHYSAPPDGTAAELAAHLAPPEERDAKLRAEAGVQTNGGTILVDAGVPALADSLGTARKKSRLFEDRVVIVLVTLALLFTSFIAWRVSKMTDEPQPVRIIRE